MRSRIWSSSRRIADLGTFFILFVVADRTDAGSCNSLERLCDCVLGGLREARQASAWPCAAP